MALIYIGDTLSILIQKQKDICLKTKNITSAPVDKNILAYGVEPSTHSYLLRLARYKSLAKAVATYASDSESCSLLDVGVGRGRSMRYIEAENIAHKIDFYGFDLSPDRLKNIYAPDRWKLVNGNILNGIPYRSNNFDVVLCEQVLEHLDDPAFAMKEIIRVLKPGGLLVMGVPIFPWGVSHIRQYLVALGKKFLNMNRSHVQTFHVGSAKRLLCKNKDMTVCDNYGFRIVSGGIIARLENYQFWYNLNQKIGKVFPHFCTEIQIVAKKDLAL